jgi:hypothetical protein
MRFIKKIYNQVIIWLDAWWHGQDERGESKKWI